MKNLGILILLAGLGLGVYSLNMDVSVDVPARSYGYGIETRQMKVANIDKMAQRQNFMVFSGILSVVGSILLGFGSTQNKQPITRTGDVPPPAPTTPEADAEFMRQLIAAKVPSICPKCFHLGAGDDTLCARCNATLKS